MGQQCSSGSFSNTMLLPADFTKRAIFTPSAGKRCDCNATVHLPNTMGQQCSSGSLSNTMLLPADTHTKRTAQRIGAHYVTKRNELPPRLCTPAAIQYCHTCQTCHKTYNLLAPGHPDNWDGFQDHDSGRQGYSEMSNVSPGTLRRFSRSRFGPTRLLWNATSVVKRNN